MLTDSKYKLGISSNGNKPRYYSEPSDLPSIIGLREDLIAAMVAGGLYCRHCRKDVIPDNLNNTFLRCSDCKGLLKPRFNYTIEPEFQE